MGVLDRFDRKAISTWSWKWKETQFRPFTNRKITPTTGKNGQDTGLVQANLGKIRRIILIYPHGSSNVVPWKVKKAKEAEKARMGTGTTNNNNNNYYYYYYYIYYYYYYYFYFYFYYSTNRREDATKMAATATTTLLLLLLLQQQLLLLLLLLLHMTIKKDKKMRTSLFRWSKKHCVLMAGVLFFSRSLQMFCRMIFGRHENSRSCPEGWPTVFGFWAVFVQGKKSERSWEGSAFWSIHCAACEKMRCNENRAPTNMKFSQNAVVPKHLSLLILRHLITSACLQTRCLPSELQDPSSMEFPGSF